MAALTKYDLAPARTPVQAAEPAIDDEESVSTETFALRCVTTRSQLGGAQETGGVGKCRGLPTPVRDRWHGIRVETTGPPGPQEK